MDLINKEDERKIKKKLHNTAQNIRKKRKNPKILQKENQEFQEIKQLLNTSDNEFSDTEVQIELSGKIYDFESSYTIPLSAPGLKIFHKKKIFLLFDSERLRFSNYSKDISEFNIFGKGLKAPNEDIIRHMIAHGTTETILPGKEECRFVSLYVLYLMAVHPDIHFASACLDFLKFRRFKIHTEEILPLFINFGTTVETLVGSELHIEPSFKCQPKISNSDIDFPFHNFDLVADFILYSIDLDLIIKEPQLKVLLKAIARLTLDNVIRASSLLSKYSTVLSLLSSKLTEVYDLEDITSCLHLKEEHFLNQVEIVKVVLMPICPYLQEALIIKIINGILLRKILKSARSIKIKDIKSILLTLQQKTRTPLKTYCALQLINTSLPNITATSKDTGDINNILLSLEASFLCIKDPVDLVRLKLEIAKLRNYLMKNAENKFLVKDWDISTCHQGRK